MDAYIAALIQVKINAIAKPLTGMIDKQKEFEIDPQKAYVVGDGEWLIWFWQNIMRGILVLTGVGKVV